MPTDLLLLDPANATAKDSRLAPPLGSENRVIARCVYLRAGPSATSAIQSELLYGQKVYVQDVRGQMSQVVNAADHYQGWVPSHTLLAAGRPNTHRVIARSTHLYSEPSVKAETIMALSMGSRVTAHDHKTDRFTQTTAGWLVTDHMVSLNDRADDYMALATTWLGSPYLWGGKSAWGIDCSGLVQVVLEAAGLLVHRDSDLQYASIGDPIDPNEPAQKGDLAFFPGHVGFMVDHDHILHANATHMSVTIDPLDDVIEWVKSDLTSADKPPFLGFKRPCSPNSI